LEARKAEVSFHLFAAMRKTTIVGLVLGPLGHQAGLRVAQVPEQTLKSMND
jgi:hypothetical protein